MTYRITLLAAILCFFIVPMTVKAAEDNTAPQITALNLTPDTVNTESAEQTLTVTMTLTDNQAGVCTSGDCGAYNSSATQLRLVSPNGEQTADVSTLTRTSGDDLSGTYTGTTTIPQYSQSGIWQIDYLLLADKLGNYNFLYTADLESAFGAGVGDVNNTAAVEDVTDPIITDFALSPSSVNTDAADVEIALSMTITDDLAGTCIVSDPCGVIGVTQMRLISPNGSQRVDISTLTRSAGTVLNGTYTGTTTLPQGSVPGTWSVDYVFVVDAVGNDQFIYKADLETTFGAGVADIVNTATITDTERPQITAFDITPTEINTSEEGQTLTLTMTLTDNAVGVCIPDDCGSYYNSSGTQLRLKPLIGTQFVDFSSLTRLSGDSLSGVYQATATVPKSSKEGLWQVDYLLLADKLGNYEFLYANDLNALFPDASGLLITNTAEASSVTIQRDWTISSTRASATFSNGTVVTKKEGGSFAFYKMVNQAFSVDSLTEDGLIGDPVRTIRFGIPGLNLEFSQNVTISLNVGADYNGRILNIQSLSEDGIAWANETECTVADSMCSFTVNHATYFTANTLPKHSIVVSAKTGGGPHVTVWSSGGKRLASFSAYPSTYHGGVTAIMADLNNDGKNEIITAPDGPGMGRVQVFTAKGKKLATLYPFTKTFSNGISLAAGDVDEDGRAEIVVAPSTGGGPNVRVYDYKGGRLTLHKAWSAYAASYRQGVTLSLGDVNGDGKDEIVTVKNTGAAPHVRVFSDKGKVIGQFYAFARTFLGGVNLTVADVNTDGKDDIIVTPKSAGGPQVRVMRPNGTVIKQFFAYPSTWRIGLTTGIGDYDNDDKPEIITAPSSGEPQIRVFSRSGTKKTQFLAYANTFRGGVVIDVGDVDGDSYAEIVTAPLSGGSPNVKVFNDNGRVRSFVALLSSFRGGLNISIAE